MRLKSNPNPVGACSQVALQHQRWTSCTFSSFVKVCSGPVSFARNAISNCAKRLAQNGVTNFRTEPQQRSQLQAPISHFPTFSNISHLGKRKIISFLFLVSWGYTLVPRRVIPHTTLSLQVCIYKQLFLAARWGKAAWARSLFFFDQKIDAENVHVELARAKTPLWAHGHPPPSHSSRGKTSSDAMPEDPEAGLAFCCANDFVPVACC